MEGRRVPSEGYRIYNKVSLGPESSKFHLLPFGLCLLFLITVANNVAAVYFLERKKKEA
jgi:hypothetical protein